MPFRVWQIDERPYQKLDSSGDKIQFLLQYGILAPSAHNIQPWKYEIRKKSLLIGLDESRYLQISDPTRRQSLISIGAFIENLSVAARAFGLKSRVTYRSVLPSSFPLAEITFLQTQSGRKNPGLRNAICARHTNRGPYVNGPIPEDVIKRTSKLGQGDAILLLPDQLQRKAITLLISQGVKIALSLSRLRRDLERLVSRESDCPRRGLTLESMIHGSASQLSQARWITKQLRPSRVARQTATNFASSPFVGVIATRGDDATSWLSAGRLLERILLVGAQAGLSHDIAAAPVEIPTLHRQLRTLLHTQLRPQVVFRLGKPVWPTFTRLSPRIPA